LSIKTLYSHLKTYAKQGINIIPRLKTMLCSCESLFIYCVWCN